LCSIPSRVKSLAETVKSILPHVDKLHVFLNGYGRVPDFLENGKIVVALSQDYGDRGDTNKFFWADKIFNCYHFVCDDDLIYKKEYFDLMIKKQIEYGKKCVTGFAGAVIGMDKAAFSSYYRSRRQIHFTSVIEKDTRVHVIGTGAMCYHTSLLPNISINDFKHPNMSDIWFSVKCKKGGMPLMVIQRDKGKSTYMVSTELYDITDTIYYQSTKSNAVGNFKNTHVMQTSVIRDNYPWPSYER